MKQYLIIICIASSLLLSSCYCMNYGGEEGPENWEYRSFVILSDTSDSIVSCSYDGLSKATSPTGNMCEIIVPFTKPALVRVKTMKSNFSFSVRVTMNISHSVEKRCNYRSTEMRISHPIFEEVVGGTLHYARYEYPHFSIGSSPDHFIDSIYLKP